MNGTAHGIDVAQEAIGHFRRILWVFVHESIKAVTHDEKVHFPHLSKGQGGGYDILFVTYSLS